MKFDIKGIFGRARARAQGIKFQRSDAEPGALAGRFSGASPWYYEALRNADDRTRMLTASFLSGSEMSRRELALLAHALYENSGAAALAVDMLAQYSTPILTAAASSDPGWNDASDAEFDSFCARADFYGRPTFTFSEIQRTACAHQDLSGDILAVLTRAGGYPQIQTIPAHRITSPDKAADNIEQGLERDSMGRLAAYWIADETGEKFQRIPAGSAFLLYEPGPGSEWRGISPLRRGLNDLRDARDIIGFEKSAVKINAANPGLIEGASYEDPKGEFAQGEEGDESEEASPLPDKVARLDLTGKDILQLTGGRKWVQITPNRPNAQFGEFMDSLVGLFVSGLGLPPAFFLDAKMTGPGWRAVIGKAQRRFDQRQEVFARFALWTRSRVISDAMESGRLPFREDWDRARVQRPARLTIDLGDQESADLSAFEKRLLTRTEYFAKRQKSWDDELAASIAEDERVLEGCKTLAQRTGIPLELILARYGFEVQKQNPNDPKK